MDLVRDLLDKQVLDREGRKMGKVDGIVLELRKDMPPRVAFVEIGPVTLARRFGPALGRLMKAMDAGLGVGDGSSLRIPLSKVGEVGIDVRVDLEADKTRVWAWEEWLRRHVVGRIPGAGSRS
jgi:sporulation protein YlmC with PRC-barrel domain